MFNKLFSILSVAFLFQVSIDPSLAHHNPAIFSVLQGAEKLNKSLQADKKPRLFQYDARV